MTGYRDLSAPSPLPPRAIVEGRAKRDARKVAYALAAMAVASMLLFPGLTTIGSVGALYISLSFVWRLHRPALDGNERPLAGWKVVTVSIAAMVVTAALVVALRGAVVWVLIALPVGATLVIAVRSPTVPKEQPAIRN